MLQQKVKEASTSLFRKRVKDAEQFWAGMNKKKKEFLLGTSLLIDGEFENAKNLLDRLEPSFNIKYNWLSAYKLHGLENEYNHLKTELEKEYGLLVTQNENVKIKKKIAFFLSYLGNSGAVKMLLTHKKWLEEDGYEIDFFIAYQNKGLELDYELFNEKLKIKTYSSDKDLRKIASKYDIAVAPHWDFLFPLHQHFKKVFYFTQGDYDIYSEETNAINLLRQFYWLPNHVFTVSNYLQGHVQRKQFRKPPVIPCGIDLNVFYPGDKFENPTVLIMGPAGVKQKRVIDVITQLLIFRERENFDIIWINPDNKVTEVEGLKIINNPSQTELAKYLRKTHILVSGSDIESFSLPPLEAMASGVVVLSSNNGGITQYAKHGENALLFGQGDWEAMIIELNKLLNDQNLYESLKINGLETSTLFDENNIKMQFLNYFEKNVNSNFIFHP